MELSQQDAVQITEKVAEGISHGLTDREIAGHIVGAVGSDLHVQLGRVPKAEDLVGIIRIGLTDGFDGRGVAESVAKLPDATGAILKIIDAARDGYKSANHGDLLGWPESLVEARRHTSGDSLADFIVNELHEVTRGSENPNYEAIQAMEAARGQIDAVLQELYKLAD